MVADKKELCKVQCGEAISYNVGGHSRTAAAVEGMNI